MYLANGTFDEAVSLLIGFDLATHREALRGFRDWIAKRTGHESNLHWSGLILQIAFPGQDFSKGLSSKADQQTAISVLVSQLEEFLNLKEDHV